MDVLLLRFDAPLMSFGGVITDNNGPGVTDAHPGLSMITGLLGNALGWTHGDVNHLMSLQSALRIASRLDRPGQVIVDFQTVDLGQAHLREPGWTTRGDREHRAGGSSAKFGTHIRKRHAHADRVVTVALTLGEDPPVGLDALEDALRRPTRPLFLGRKAYLPSAPLLLERVQSASLVTALAHAPAATPGPSTSPVHASWPADEVDAPDGSPVIRHDLRDWTTNIHTGSRETREGLLELPHV